MFLRWRLNWTIVVGFAARKILNSLGTWLVISSQPLETVLHINLKSSILTSILFENYSENFSRKIVFSCFKNYIWIFVPFFALFIFHIFWMFAPIILQIFGFFRQKLYISIFLREYSKIKISFRIFEFSRHFIAFWTKIYFFEFSRQNRDTKCMIYGAKIQKCYK